jgi:GMP reductase
MIIDPNIYLDFCDVLLKPKRSTIESRKDVALTRYFNFLHSNLQWMGVPIISSNMTSVTTSEVAKAMIKHDMLACSPKQIQLDTHYNVIPSIGLKEPIEEFEYGFVCIDVPNANLQIVVDRIKQLRDKYQETIILIVGNVVTGSMTEALILAGADIVKVGIGSGAACSTRIKTGVGMPQLSAVIECADAAHGLGGHIISDGGCVQTGDVIKAFAGGADFVMLGGMLAGHNENAQNCSGCNGKGYTSFSQPIESPRIQCGTCDGSGKIYDFYGSSSERGNNENAGGLKNYRASEGWEVRLEAKGPLDKTLQDIEGGLRSACSYLGSHRLKDISKCATMMLVNNQANTSLWDHRV